MVQKSSNKQKNNILDVFKISSSAESMALNVIDEVNLHLKFLHRQDHF